MNLKKLVKPTGAAEETKNRQEEMIHKHWLKIERGRKQKEKYEIREIPGWMYWGIFVPFLGAIGLGLINFFTDKDTTTWWIVGFLALPSILFGFASEIQESWNASVKGKLEVDIERNINTDWNESFGNSYKVNGQTYRNGYVYIDGVFDYWVYLLTKIVACIATLMLGAVSAILLFMWLGSITVAPTTIIIILLLILILREKKDSSIG